MRKLDSIDALQNAHCDLASEPRFAAASGGEDLEVGKVEGLRLALLPVLQDPADPAEIDGEGPSDFVRRDVRGLHCGDDHELAIETARHYSRAIIDMLRGRRLDVLSSQRQGFRPVLVKGGRR
ncbi:MAG: hypothetical protein HOW73_20335 [Polyangiaceae bacterium]|nr:hypothetical protein [Polyangiaceae bacterium]